MIIGFMKVCFNVLAYSPDSNLSFLNMHELRLHSRVISILRQTWLQKIGVIFFACSFVLTQKTLPVKLLVLEITIQLTREKL